MAKKPNPPPRAESVVGPTAMRHQAGLVRQGRIRHAGISQISLTHRASAGTSEVGLPCSPASRPYLADRRSDREGRLRPGAAVQQWRALSPCIPVPLALLFFL